MERKKYIYLCTNALLLKEKIDLFKLHWLKYLTFSVHMDGQPGASRFFSVPRGHVRGGDGGIREAVSRGFLRHHEHHAFRRRPTPAACRGIL